MEIQVQREAQATAQGAEKSYGTASQQRRPRPERPGEWSESALRVLRERYLVKRNGEVVETPDEMCWRVATSVAAAELRWASSDTVAEFEVAFYEALMDRKFMPNSPTLMNAGTGN